MVEKGVREVFGVFHRADDLEAAIDDLQFSGIDRSRISLLASDPAIEDKLGHRYERAMDVADDPNAPRAAYFERESVGAGQGVLFGGLFYVGAVAGAGAVVASGGALLPILAGAAAAGGTGGLIGAVLARRLQQRHAQYLQNQIDRGGLVLWVHGPTLAGQERVTEIMLRHGAEEVHAHEI